MNLGVQFPHLLVITKKRVKIIYYIISSQHLYFLLKLGLNHFVKPFKKFASLLFFLHKKDPSESSVIIYIWSKPPSSSDVINSRWSPYITLNNWIWMRWLIWLIWICARVCLASWKILQLKNFELLLLNRDGNSFSRYIKLEWPKR